jgi:hypothetical protein
VEIVGILIGALFATFPLILGYFLSIFAREILKSSGNTDACIMLIKFISSEYDKFIDFELFLFDQFEVFELEF